MRVNMGKVLCRLNYVSFICCSQPISASGTQPIRDGPDSSESTLLLTGHMPTSGRSYVPCKSPIVIYTTKGEPYCFHLMLVRDPIVHGRYTSLGSTYNTFRNPALRIQPCCDNAPSSSDPAATPKNNAQTPTIASIPRNSTTDVPEDILGPSLTHVNGNCIPDGLVPLKLNASEICFADSGECTSSQASVIDVDVSYDEHEHHCTHEERYRPAYELVDGNLERAGRASSQPVPLSCTKPGA